MKDHQNILEKCFQYLIKTFHWIFWWSFKQAQSQFFGANFEDFGPEWRSSFYLRNWFSRSSHRRCSIKKAFYKNFAKLTGKHLCQTFFFFQKFLSLLMLLLPDNNSCRAIKSKYCVMKLAAGFDLCFLRYLPDHKNTAS